MTDKQKEIALKNIKEVMKLRQELFVSQRKEEDTNILLKQAVEALEIIVEIDSRPMCEGDCAEIAQDTLNKLKESYIL